MASPTKKMAVFPASGGLGTCTYNHLLKLVDPSNVVFICRYPEKIPANIKATGVEIRTGDYDKPDTLEHVFDGVWCLNIISYPTLQNEHRTLVHKRAIDAAHRSRVSHIIYSSLAFGGDCEPKSVSYVMQPHLKTEEYLEELAAADKNFTYTVVREGLYSESFPLYTSFLDIKSPRKDIAIPHDGSAPGVAWAKQDDLGEATARLISSYVKDPKDFEYTNKKILLSGTRSVSLAETVEILSKALGKPLNIRPVSVAEYSELPQVRKIWPKGQRDTPEQWALSFEAIKKGETSAVTPHLSKILGREPEPFEKTVSELVRRSL